MTIVLAAVPVLWLGAAAALAAVGSPAAGTARMVERALASDEQVVRLPDVEASQLPLAA